MVPLLTGMMLCNTIYDCWHNTHKQRAELLEFWTTYGLKHPSSDSFTSQERATLQEVIKRNNLMTRIEKCLNRLDHVVVDCMQNSSPAQQFGERPSTGKTATMAWSSSKPQNIDNQSQQHSNSRKRFVCPSIQYWRARRTLSCY
jgi:hypothetical protein